jgi:hypothetical protein
MVADRVLLDRMNTTPSEDSSPLDGRTLAAVKPARSLMDLEELEVQRPWPAGRNPVMPALLAGIHNQDEMSVAIHFDRDTPSGRALRTMGQSSVGGGHRGGQSPVSCGHRSTIGGA